MSYKYLFLLVVVGELPANTLLSLSIVVWLSIPASVFYNQLF